MPKPDKPPGKPKPPDTPGKSSLKFNVAANSQYVSSTLGGG